MGLSIAQQQEQLNERWGGGGGGGRRRGGGEGLLFVGRLASQQHASVSQGWICTDNFTCCHTEIEVACRSNFLPHPVTVY